MNDLLLTVQELKAKVLAAAAVASLGELRQLAVPMDGASFKIGNVPYVWVAADRTPDDGAGSIKPANLPASAPGRYRRITIRMPFQKS